MRIISGKYRGFLIVEPQVETTRVTKERVREGVFSALGSEVRNKTVLDLFAGSGSMGFEAFSRGAAEVRFVDSNFSTVTAMNKTKNNLKIMDNSLEIIYGSYPFVLTRFNCTFDLIFIDPPYGEFAIVEIIKDLYRHGIANVDTIFVVEDLSHFENNFVVSKRTRTYKYGINHVTILEGVNING